MSALPPAEFQRRIRELRSLLSPCRVCPHECGVDRLAGERGRCGSGAGAVVCSATSHFGEEPEIAGSRGSGAVFFGGCNLRCRYCQNAGISQSREVRRRAPTPIAEMARQMKALQERGCHNVNWVSPSHVVPYAVEALSGAVEAGLTLPLVYNTSGFDSVETLELLDGLVDVYLPDLRYGDDQTAYRLSRAVGYVSRVRAAILEMARQVGTDNRHAPDDTIRRGLIVRLLVLPNGLSGIRESLAFLRDSLGTGIRIALMSQYFPTHRAPEHPLLSRNVHFGEYHRAVDLADRMGFDNALVQGLESSEFYRPDFDEADEPFRDAAAFHK